MAKLTAKIVERAESAVSRRILLSIPDGRGIDLVCVTLTREQVGRARKGALRRWPKSDDDVQRDVQFCSALLAEATVQVLVDSEVWETDEGDTLTFKSRDEWPSLARKGMPAPTTASEAARAVIGRDGDVQTLGNALLKESGFASNGSSVVSDEGEENPT